MIEFRDVSVRFGPQEVLTGVNLRVSAGERVGIVGPNGSGKSTLFRLLLGEHTSDAGDVLIEGSPRIGHVRQLLAPTHDEETLLEYTLRGMPHVHDLEQQIHAVEARVATITDEPVRSQLLRQMGELQTAFEHLGGYRLEAQAKIALGGLGFTVEDFTRTFRAFSGGWQMRAELARVLAAKPDLLLLDEPSNYLDLPAVEWLQRFLRGFDGTLLLISHDRYLLRSLTRITVEVDAGTVTRYSGDLDYYLREREQRLANLVAAKRNQDRQREQLERFIERFKAKNTKAAQAQSRVRVLEKMEEIRLPKRGTASGSVRIARAPHSGAEIVRLEDVGFSYDGSRDVLRAVNLNIARGEKLALVGYNGMGKTTLLRLLAGVRTPSSGRVVLGHRVLIGYQSQEFGETIAPELTVLGCAHRAAPTLTERELRTQLGSFGFTADDVNKPSHVLSGGEKIRLAFLRLFLAPPNFLLLDEPTTHLDLEGRRTLELALHAFDGTVCLVSHDVEFVRAVAGGIIEIGPAGVRRFPGGYDYYREKTAAEPAAVNAPEESSVDVRGGARNSRDLRRARALERTRRQPRAQALRQAVSRAEKQIAELEAELAKLETDIGAGAAARDYAGSCRRFKIVQETLEGVNHEWEQAALELESLLREQEAALAALAGDAGDDEPMPES